MIVMVLTLLPLLRDVLLFSRWGSGRFINVLRLFPLHFYCHPTFFLPLYFTYIMSHFCSATRVFPERKQPEHKPRTSLHPSIDHFSYRSGILIDIGYIRSLCSGILIRFTPYSAYDLLWIFICFCHFFDVLSPFIPSCSIEPIFSLIILFLCRPSGGYRSSSTRRRTTSTVTAPTGLANPPIKVSTHWKTLNVWVAQCPGLSLTANPPSICWLCTLYSFETSHLGMADNDTYRDARTLASAMCNWNADV